MVDATMSDSSSNPISPSKSFSDMLSVFNHSEAPPSRRTSPRKRILLVQESTTSPRGIGVSYPETNIASKKLKPGAEAPKKSSQGKGRKEKADWKTLPPLVDCIQGGLDVLFCGYNPGVASASYECHSPVHNLFHSPLLANRKEHHFAGPTNHFWPCLTESGFGNGQKITYLDDTKCPKDFNFGLTNLVSRCTPGADDLSQTEMIEGVGPLKEKIRKYRPRIVAFVGKEVYRHFVGVAAWNGGKAFKWGLQSRKISYSNTTRSNKEEGENEASLAWTEGLLYVMPSTSGRVASYLKADKLKMFVKLKKIVDSLKAGQEIHAEEEAETVQSPANGTNEAEKDGEE